MKKWLLLIMTVLVCLSLFAGCGDAAQETAAEVGQIDYADVKIGMLLDNTATSQGWHKEHVDSIYRAVDDLGLDRDSQLLIVENIIAGTPDVESTIMQMVNEGCNLIIGTSSGYVTSFQTAAQNYPDVKFLEFEGASDKNLTPCTINDIDAIFMLGYGAALMSEGDKLGMVVPFPQAGVVRFVDAWAAGAKAANPNATVQIVWTNSWFDPAAEKECANGLLAEGITCIGYYGCSTAVAAACEEAGAYVTGIAEELHGAAPNALLNTLEWNWTPIYESAINQLVTEQWSSDLIVIGSAEDGARIRAWNDQIMSAEQIMQCESLWEDIKTGEYTVLEGPVYDNQGNEVLAEGETFTIEELTDCSFLLDNVIGSLI